MRGFFLAAGLGFEPRQNESESFVLPLHNPAIFVTENIIAPFGTQCNIVFAKNRTKTTQKTKKRTRSFFHYKFKI